MDEGEVFPKADLSELPKTGKSKAKLKKRELCGGIKAKSKPNAKRQKDSAQLRPKQQQMLVNQENRLSTTGPVVGLGRSKNQSLPATNGRLGNLRNSKAKISETVTARKVLGNLQSNVPPTNQLHYDLQRVLGKGSPPLPTAPPPPSCKPTHSESKEKTISSGTDMEYSPDTKTPSSSSLPLVEISQRLVEGLQVEVIFPHSSYLENTKAELQKVLKQSSPFGYEELMGYFSNSGPPLLAPGTLMTEFQHTLLPPEMEGLGVVTTCDPASHPTPTLSFDTAPPPNGIPGHGSVSDIIALNLEVNTSALNINDRLSPDHTPRPRDFLDILDNTHQDTPTGWNTTPTRPRMFPHKLY